MQSYYEINVSQLVDWSNGRPRYKDLFATAPRLCVDIVDAQRVFVALKARFPEPEFQISTTHYACVGRQLELQP